MGGLALPPPCVVDPVLVGDRIDKYIPSPPNDLVIFSEPNEEALCPRDVSKWYVWKPESDRLMVGSAVGAGWMDGSLVRGWSCATELMFDEMLCDT